MLVWRILFSDHQDTFRHFRHSHDLFPGSLFFPGRRGNLGTRLGDSLSISSPGPDFPSKQARRYVLQREKTKTVLQGIKYWLLLVLNGFTLPPSCCRCCCCCVLTNVQSNFVGFNINSPQSRLVCEMSSMFQVHPSTQVPLVPIIEIQKKRMSKYKVKTNLKDQSTIN